MPIFSPKKKFNPHVLISILVLMGFACTTRFGKVEIVLKVPNWAGRWVYYRNHDSENTFFDSVLVSSKGIGTVTFQTTEPIVVAFTLDKKSYPLLVVAKPDEIINLTYSNGWQVNGSLETARVIEFQEKIDKTSQFLSEFEQKIESLDSSNVRLKDSLLRVFGQVKDSLKDVLRNEAFLLASSNPYDLSSAFIVNAQLNSEQLLPYNKYSKLYHKVDSSLASLYPQKQIVLDFRKTLEFHRFTDSISRIENVLYPGMVIPTLQFETFDGKSITIPGIWAKWLLLYFLDKESIENSSIVYGLKNLYSRYKPAGIEMVTFGVKADSLVLVQKAISDSIGWPQIPLNDELSLGKLQLYGIARLPGNILIDRWGKVLAKNAPLQVIAEKLDSLSRVSKPKPAIKPKADTVPANSPQ